jgi:hypothetical protein
LWTFILKSKSSPLSIFNFGLPDQNPPLRQSSIFALFHIVHCTFRPALLLHSTHSKIMLWKIINRERIVLKSTCVERQWSKMNCLDLKEYRLSILNAKWLEWQVHIAATREREISYFLCRHEKMNSSAIPLR